MCVCIYIRCCRDCLSLSCVFLVSLFGRSLFAWVSCDDFRYRVSKTHRIPYLERSFYAKEPEISGSFAKIDVQLEASYVSLPPCTLSLKRVCASDLSHTWMRHVMNASYHTHEWVMSHVWIRHVTHMNESCHTHECVMSHIWMHHIAHMNESVMYNVLCHTISTECACISSITHTNASCHTHQWVSDVLMSHTWMGQQS